MSTDTTPTVVFINGSEYVAASIMAMVDYGDVGLGWKQHFEALRFQDEAGSLDSITTDHDEGAKSSPRKGENGGLG